MISGSYLDPPDDFPDPPACPKCGDDGFGEEIGGGGDVILYQCDNCGCRWFAEVTPEPDGPEPDAARERRCKR